LVAERVFPKQTPFPFYPVKPQIIDFQSTDVNIAFSDIRHKNKKSLVKKLVVLNQREKQFVRYNIHQNL